MLQLLKLGGSLITEKDKPHSVRLVVIRRLADEIAQAFQQNPQMRLILGHGSGSFGHVPAKIYGTRQGVQSAEQWHGFVQVWREAAQLNHLVMDALSAAGLPAIAFPPSAGLLARDGRVSRWNLEPMRAALAAGLLPVVYGDVVFDRQRGGTIFSTEDLFEHLALSFSPGRVLLAGIEPGVWADYPVRQRIHCSITPDLLPQVLPGLQGAQVADVTGGMASKVLQSMRMVQNCAGLEVLIFSGMEDGALFQALTGASPGTRIFSA